MCFEAYLRAFVTESPQTSSDRDTHSQFRIDADRETQNILQSGDNCESARGQDTGTEKEEEDRATEKRTNEIRSPAVPQVDKSRQQCLDHTNKIT